MSLPAAAEIAPARVPLWPAYVAAVATILGISAVGVVVPLHVEELGGRVTDAGLITGIRFGLGVFFSLPFGAVADAWGPRRALVVAIAAAAAVNLIPLLAAPTASLVPLYAWAVASGLTTSLFFPAMSAFVGGAAPAESRGSAFGWVTLFTHTGTATGPLVGGVLWDSAGIAPAYLVAAAISGVGLLGPLFVTSSERSAVDLRAMLRGIGVVARDRGIAGAWLAALAIGLPWGAVFGVFPLFGTAIGLTAGTIGLVLAVQSLANGLSRVPLGMAIDRLRLPAVTMAGSAFAYAAAVALLGLQRTALGSAVLLAVGVVALAFTLMMVQVVISERAPARLRATGLGGYGTALSAGLGLGPFVAGVTTDAGGYALGFAAVGGVAALCAVAAAVILAGARRVAATERVEAH